MDACLKIETLSAGALGWSCAGRRARTRANKTNHMRRAASLRRCGPFFMPVGHAPAALRPPAHAALPLPLVPLVGGAPCGTVLCHEPEKLTLSAPHDARMMVPVRTRARTRRLPEDSGRLGKLAGWVAHLAGVSGAHVGSADASRMPTRQATRTVQAPSVMHSICCPHADKWRLKSPLIACGGIVPCDLHTTSP